MVYNIIFNLFFKFKDLPFHPNYASSFQNHYAPAYLPCVVFPHPNYPQKNGKASTNNFYFLNNLSIVFFLK